MWPIKEEENELLLILWPNSSTIASCKNMHRYDSLDNINPSAKIHLLLLPLRKKKC